VRVNLYLERDTVPSRLHPLVKLGILASFFLSAFSMEEPLAILPLAALAFALLIAAGAGENVRRLAPLFVAVPIGSFVIWSIFYRRGTPLPGMGALGVTGEAVRYGAGMGLKLETFFAASILFLSITRVEEFTAALRALGLPYRVSFAIALAFRLVPLFLESALSVVEAQRARGLDFSRGSLFARLARYVPVIVPVFMGALRRAEGMAIALECRGFGGTRPRTTFVRARFRPADAAAVGAIAAIVAVYLYAWARGWGRIV
jgi:energy-coupling factor transport system permease protein